MKRDRESDNNSHSEPEAAPLTQSGLPADSPAFPIVGIGASAGGLEAFKQLLKALPGDTGMAFVLVPHLAPTHASMLAGILSRETQMPVQEVKDEPQVTPNQVYVIPPNRTMVMKNGSLHLWPRTEFHGQHRPVDAFLRSLAEDRTHQAIGVILSGTGNDGTVGLEAIKAEGGITFAQDQTAQQEGMPRSSIAAGCVDFILPPEQIAAELARIGRHPYVSPPPAGPLEAPGDGQLQDGKVDRILALLHNATGVDFREYKSTTLFRRITRRMLLHKLDGLKEYVRLLENNPTELQDLFRDILISVTSFFRDPGAFEALKATVFPRLLHDRTRNDPVRIWVLGCSSGEEAYSLAISITEYAEQSKTAIPAQVFATDLNEHAIHKARAGLYSKNIADEIPPERLSRHFVETENGYVINKSIRDMCVFARQNVLSDPPFSRMDLITCRNLLIYMEPVLQRRVVPLFHYALKPGGFLWLGTSETIGVFSDLFEPVDAKHKIYSKRPGVGQTHVMVPLSAPVWESPDLARQRRQFDTAGPAVDILKAADRAALAKYSPPGVLVNQDLEILQFRGDTSAYLAPAPGKPSANVLKMAREGLLVGLRSALQKAAREQLPVRHEGLQVKSNGGMSEINLEVVPLRTGNSNPIYHLVLFESVETATKPAAIIPPAARPGVTRGNEEAEREIVRLTQELAATREYMQSLIEQHEASNEELQSAAEEIQSSNEELQSVNEELQTSKEEIQSSNEELTTVNEELRRRNDDLDQSNNKLTNFISSTQLAVVMLAPDLRIRQFTPQAAKQFNLLDIDIGRSLADVNLPLNIKYLTQMLSEVLDSGKPKELEIRDRDGHWYSLRLRPYLTKDQRIDGAVLLLVDIDAQKRAHQALLESQERVELAMEGAAMGIWDVDVRTGSAVWSETRFQMFGMDPTPGGKASMQMWYDRIHPDDLERVKAAVERAKRDGSLFSEEHRIIRADTGAVLWLSPFGRFHYDAAGEPVRFAGVSFDNTERKVNEESLREANQRKEEFLAMLAHELRNPLAVLRNSVDALNLSAGNAAIVERVRQMMDRHVTRLTRIVDDLLDVSRINRGMITLRKERVDLAAAVAAAAESVRPLADLQHLELDVAQPESPVYVEADPTRLEQIITNLLNNAVKYTDSGGRITLTLERANTEAVVRVRDTGIGIAPSVLPRIFDLFAQADTSLDRERGGLGIGLSVVRRLVGMHGGTVQAHSDGLGRGSEFTVRLPLASNNPAPAKSAP